MYKIPKLRVIKLKTRLTYEYAKMDPTYGVCFLGFMVAEMGFILSSLYINAWVNTYFPHTIEGIIQAKSLAEQISTLTMLMGIIFGLLGGFLSDSFRLLPLIILSYGVRAVGLIMMPFVAKLRFFLFICTLCLNVGYALETVMVIYH